MASRACSLRINNPTECKAHTSLPPTLSRDFPSRDTRCRDFPSKDTQRFPNRHTSRQRPQWACPPAAQANAIFVSPRGQQALSFLMSNATCGPTDLGHVFGSSPATWSRELSNLQRSGFIHKHGQKYMLTDTGRAWMEEQMPREDVNNG